MAATIAMRRMLALAREQPDRGIDQEGQHDAEPGVDQPR